MKRAMIILVTNESHYISEFHRIPLKFKNIMR